jgi:hypothetical protein
MIELDFKIDKEEISEKTLKLINSSPNLAIQITYFLMPVRFQIDGEDFFYFKKSELTPWHAMPLIDFSTRFLGKIKDLPLKRKNKFVFAHEGYNDVRFEMQGDTKVKLKSGETKKEYIVDYNELLKVWEKFEKKVKKFLNENVPQLKEHPYWGAWIKGEANWDNDKGLIPKK